MGRSHIGVSLGGAAAAQPPMPVPTVLGCEKQCEGWQEPTEWPLGSAGGGQMCGLPVPNCRSCCPGLLHRVGCCHL